MNQIIPVHYEKHMKAVTTFAQNMFTVIYT